MISVLFVDDDTVLPGAIEAHGDVRIELVASSEDAPARLEKHPFDAVVSGHHPPGLDGIALLRDVRRLHGSMPFILCPDGGGEEVVLRAWDEGADGCLPKGDSPERFVGDLVRRIRQAVERRRARDDLHENEAHFRGIVERSSDLVFIIGEGMSPTFVSPSARKIIGYEPGELVGKPPEFALATIFSHCAPEVGRAVGETLRGRAVEGVELQVARKDGTLVDMSLKAVPVLRDGIYAGAQVTLWDISVEKAAERALAESEAKFRSFVESANDILFSLDLDGTCIYASPNWTDSLGHDPAEIVGTRPIELVHPGDRPGTDAFFREIVRTGEKGSGIEYRIRHRDGSWRWHSQSGAPIRDSAGRITAYMGICHDVTRRRRDEEAIRESEGKFRSLVETLPEIVWEVDPRGVFRYVSPRIRAIMGYAPEEVVGRSIADLVPEEKVPEMMQLLAGCFTEGAPPPPFMVPARHRNGDDLVLEIRPSMTDLGGPLNGARGVAVDITDRKRAEEALRLANRQLNLLSGITRHDLLNKVTIALGFLKLAEDTSRDPAVDALLQKVESTVTTMQSQIEFTRTYQDLGTHEPQWIDLDAVMPRTHLPPGIGLDAGVAGVEVYADPMLERVFFNLLDNSNRHGERVTRCRVACRPSGDALVIVWEDDGVGIPVDAKERIFERGYGKNTGLGMFLVREILSLTGITIVENGEPGVGARFECTVPKGMWRRRTPLP
jgi:PAS domain S-box-containing protein